MCGCGTIQHIFSLKVSLACSNQTNKVLAIAFSLVVTTGGVADLGLVADSIPSPYSWSLEGEVGTHEDSAPVGRGRSRNGLVGRSCSVCCRVETITRSLLTEESGARERIASLVLREGRASLSTLGLLSDGPVTEF
jgi:hypothetical protein